MATVYEKMTAIADNIRSKTGKTDLLTLDDMASSVNEVYDKGKKAAYDWFWDDYQQNGNRTDYICAFGSMWTPETLKPKYPVRPIKANYMFFNNMGHHIVIEDFVTFCEENNLTFDFSRCDNIMYGLAGLHTKHLGVLDISNCTYTTSLFYSHNYIDGIVTIDELISSSTTTYHTNTFQNATNLTNLTISGVISKNNFNVSACTLLTHDSLMSIVNALEDKSTDTSGTTWKVTFGSTNIAKLTAEELQIIEDKRWTYA